MPSTAGSTERARPVPAAERERFDRDGYLIIRGALTPDEVSRYAAALSALTVIRGRRFPRPGR
jgi:ectoine hydroxylase